VGVHLVKAAQTLALWVSLMAAAAGLWLWTEEVGVGLLAAGLVSAVVLFFVVDTPDQPQQPPDRSDRRTPGL
jgi:hypothetical protein